MMDQYCLKSQGFLQRMREVHILGKKKKGSRQPVLCTAETCYWHTGQKQAAQNVIAKFDS